MTFKTSLCAGVALSVAMLAAGAANAQDTTVAWKGSPQWTNDTLTFKVRGSVYQDVVSQSVDRQTGVDFDANVTRLRTARLGVEGTWNANWAYKAEASISSGGGTTAWEDLILEYRPNDTLSVMAGNFKTVALENISSSRYITFMERGPFNDVLDVGRVMNVQVKANGENWTAAVAVSGDSVIGIALGLLSAVVDNVPLVAASQGMFDLGTYPTDHPFWEFLALTTGTGGSAVIIGTAAGVAVMGIEQINFMWYLKKISWLALIGFAAGILVFLLQMSLFN